MQHTLRKIPREVDKALRERARREGRSLNEIALEALARGCGLTDEPVKYRDVSDIAGTWVDDPELDAVVADHDRIDEELWK
jgi:plasmid stability protein